MRQKVLLIVVDGLRADAPCLCGDRFAPLKAQSLYGTARTVMPSVTLPAHFSLFHSVDPDRHNILTNLYTPMVRPVDGLIDVLAQRGKRCAMLYSWEELRDLSRPGRLCFAKFRDVHRSAEVDNRLTEDANSLMRSEELDFLFLYLGQTDDAGHSFGWLSPEYLKTTENAMRCIRLLADSFPHYHLIVTADHGGHERMHGTDCPEDMQIPLLIRSPGAAPGKIEGASIKDVAPTVLDIFGVEAPSEWEGKSLLRG